jgi:hypothetical protein
LRNADAEPAVGGDGAAEILGKCRVAVACEPIVVAKARTDFLDGVAQRKLKLGEGEVDGGCSRLCFLRFCLARALDDRNADVRRDRGSGWPAEASRQSLCILASLLSRRY